MFENLPLPDASVQVLDNAIAIHQLVLAAMIPQNGQNFTRRVTLVRTAMTHCEHCFTGMKASIVAGTPRWTAVAAARTPLELATRILAAHRGIDGWDRLIGHWSHEFDTHVRLAAQHVPAVAALNQQMLAEIVQLPPLQAVPLRSFEEAVREIANWDKAHPNQIFTGEELEGFYDLQIRSLHGCAHANLIWVQGQSTEALDAIWLHAVYWTVIFILRAAGGETTQGDAWANEVLTRQLLTTPAIRAAIAQELRNKAVGQQ